jgi:hypothetical protein
MEGYESLHHTKRECKYHLVWIPKCRRKVLYGQVRKDLGRSFGGWFWARGYSVAAAELDEETIREYVRRARSRLARD